MSRWRRRISTALGLLLAIAILGIAVQWLAVLLVRELSAETAKATNDARVSLIQFLGGVGLLGGLFYTVRSFLLTRGTQRADRFSRAIDQLGNDKSATVRSGGAYNLGVLASEEEGYWPMVADLLSTLVRERATQGPVGPDVQAALSVLGRRPTAVARGRPADLRGAHLEGVTLASANLENAWLMGTNLKSADLTDGCLRRCNLENGNLQGARLSSADLREADLTGADLSGADVYRVSFEHTILDGANLSGIRNLIPGQLSADQLKMVAIAP
jgi:hypothetical protein